MQAVYGNYNNNNLGCTAKEVYANNDAATAVEGPTKCVRGEYITVNVTASIHFNADRLDVGIYTATSTCNPTKSADCGLHAATCAVDILDTVDNARAPNNIKTSDSPSDVCLDVVTSGGGYDLAVYDFQPNLRLPCDE